MTTRQYNIQPRRAEASKKVSSYFSVVEYHNARMYEMHDYHSFEAAWMLKNLIMKKI
jgi:hypothetical protein